MDAPHASPAKTGSYAVHRFYEKTENLGYSWNDVQIFALMPIS